MTKKLFVLFALIVIMAMTVAGCGSSTTPAPAAEPSTAEQPVEQPTEAAAEEPAAAPEEPTAVPEEPAAAATEPKVLRLQFAEPQMEPDMAKSNTSISIAWSGLVNDYLLGYDQNNQPIMMLAETYEPNEDYSVWTVKLRDNAAFNDGTPVTTEDLAWSIKHYQENETQKAIFDLIKEVEIVDAKTAKLHLTEPHSDWLLLHPVAIYSKTCADGCDFYSADTPTSGPWHMVEYVPKSHMTLERNPNYWGLKEADPFPKIDSVDWVFQSDMTATLAAMEAGERDLGYVVPKDAERLKSNPSLYLTTVPGVDGFVGWGMNKTKAPWSDQRVRKAASMLLEPEEKTAACWDGYATNIWGGLIYQEDKGWEDLFISTYKDMTREERLAEADKLLTEAGWTDQDGDGIRESKGVEGLEDGTKFSMKVVYESNWPQAECHTLLLKDWAAEAGLDLQPESYDPGAYWTDAMAGKFDMWHVGLPGSLLPYQRAKIMYHTDGSYNKYGAWINDTELDAMIDASLAEQDPAKKRELVAALQNYLFEKQYMLVDGAQSIVYAINSAVQPFYIHYDQLNSYRSLLFSDINR